MAEKNIDPTPHRLRDAREKGQVPVSRDVASCVLLGLGMETAFALEGIGRQRLAGLFDLSLRATQSDFMTVFSGLVAASAWLLMLSFLIYAGIGVAAGILGYWGQFGVLFSATPLVPSIDKLNPINTIKNIFSKRKLMEVLMAIGKLVAIGLLSYVMIRSELPALVSLAGGNATHSHAAAVEMIRGLFHVLFGVSVCVALVDFFVQRQAHKKQLRMSMEEVIREYKENEGDPLIKGARKEFAFELLYSDPVTKTEQANAVVVNPTHFAVAMLFDPQTAPVPIVCAKGRDETARAMIQRAKERGIPVIRHVWLARTLYATAKEQRAIPRSLFDPVALLYSVVEQLKQEGEHYAELDGSGRPPNSTS
jgi:type III secretion protein U